VLKRPFLARLSPRRGYQVPSRRPAAQRIRSSTNHRVTAYREKTNAKKWCNLGALFALFLLRFCTLALLCMLSGRLAFITPPPRPKKNAFWETWQTVLIYFSFNLPLVVGFFFFGCCGTPEAP
jgi:hypothetical protein